MPPSDIQNFAQGALNGIQSYLGIKLKSQLEEQSEDRKGTKLLEKETALIGLRGEEERKTQREKIFLEKKII